MKTLGTIFYWVFILPAAIILGGAFLLIAIGISKACEGGYKYAKRITENTTIT